MKILLEQIDRNSFYVNEHNLNGDLVYLVTPKVIGCLWTPDTLIFRSSVWNLEGNLISASFPKFFNWSERQDISPIPKSLKNATVVEKLDGSLLCVSKYKGKFILRTRGTIDASNIDNGYELELFKETILTKLQNNDNGDTWNYSVLFEWLSPVNVIVLKYSDKPTWKLIGLINHFDYSLVSQSVLDAMAKNHDLLRPETYSFPCVEDLIKDVDGWIGKEGVVVYTNNSQTLHKVKSIDYLRKHRFKSSATLENTLELYFTYNRPPYHEFELRMIQAFDYECFEMVRTYVSQICDAEKQVSNILDGFKSFISNQLQSTPTRKEQAQKILSSYGKTNRASFVFTMLDGRALSDDQIKKLFWQVLKK